MNSSALIIVWEFPPGPGGIGQHAFSLAYALSRKSVNVNVVTSGHYADKSLIRQFDLENRELNIRRVNGSRLIRYVKRCAMVMWYTMRLRPDMVFLSGKSALWFFFVVKPLVLRRSKIYGFVHGSEVFLPSQIEKRLTQLSMKRVDELICVSNFTKRLVDSSVKRLRSSSVLANGLLVSLMPNENPAPIDSISKKGCPRLLTVGRISPRKGQLRVIKALPYLRKMWPDVHYHIVGIDSAKDQLISLAKSLGVENHITIHGVLSSREELFSAYCSVDVFIMLSQNQADGDVEGYGIAILEANFFGLPAIGSRGCGIEDAIEEGLNGYLVDGDDPQQICLALSDCLSNQSLRTGARQWARDHDWDSLVSFFLDSNDAKNDLVRQNHSGI